MARPEAAVADLVPLADRLRWMLTYRMAVVAFIPMAAAMGVISGAPFGWPFLVGAGWLLLTALTLPAKHLGRRVALSLFTASLLGDGLLLGALRPYLDWLGSQVEIIIIGHVVAVTLLASFRTGAKITLWHLLVCFLVLEARAAGLIGPTVEVPFGRFAAVMSLMWLIMTATASFAAVNERELRRRRYDTQRLQEFGAAVSQCLEPTGAVALLAGFAREELLARRVAVLLYPGPSASGVANPGMAYVMDNEGVRQEPVSDGPGARSVVRVALESAGTVLAGRLNTAFDSELAAVLPGARSLVVVPFTAEEAVGALVIEHPRWSSQRASRRVELRMIDTAEQATAQASLGIGRALLLGRTRQAAQTDGLTGLANRRAFDERLTAEVERTAAGGAPVTLVMIDLDHFKRLNDIHGHQIGDEVLRVTARILAESSSASAFPARYGGEEFVLILPETNLAEGLVVAEGIRVAIATAAMPAPVTASFGLACCPDFGRTPQELLTAADAALYEAKEAGRDRVVSVRHDARAA